MPKSLVGLSIPAMRLSFSHKRLAVDTRHRPALIVFASTADAQPFDGEGFFKSLGSCRVLAYRVLLNPVAMIVRRAGKIVRSPWMLMYPL